MTQRIVPPTPALVLLGLLALAGCPAPRLVRPQPGEQVTPEVVPAGRWRAGQKASLTVRLVVEGKAAPARLLPEEVPDETTVRAEITFLEGDRPLKEPVRVDLLPPTC
jgi:hypothetical protein